MSSNEFIAHVEEQSNWSEETFGPPNGIAGVVAHLRKGFRCQDNSEEGVA